MSTGCGAGVAADGVAADGVAADGVAADGGGKTFNGAAVGAAIGSAGTTSLGVMDAALAIASCSGMSGSAVLAADDLVYIPNAAAYTTAYASTFNGFPLPEVRVVTA